MDGSCREFCRWQSVRTLRQQRAHLIIPDFGT